MKVCTKFVTNKNVDMKKIIVLGLFMLCALGVKAQTQRIGDIEANWSAATYYAYDTTTFILNVAQDVNAIIVDYSDLNADDAVLKIGLADAYGVWAGDLQWSGSTSADSVILDATTNAKTIRKSDGTRYTVARQSFITDKDWPGGYVAFTIVWNSVTSGRIKIYY
jgi:hypothetical protein